MASNQQPTRRVVLSGGTFYVASHGHTYQATTMRLNEAAKAHKLGLTITSKRSPRVATIRKKNSGRSIQTDRLWTLSQGLQETAEIIHKLQQLDGPGKKAYYKKLGL